MADLSPKRTWSPESIGTVEWANLPRCNPDQAGAVGITTPRIIEAGITFKTQEAFDPLENARRVNPMQLPDLEARARKALWRHVHHGLQGPLFNALDKIQLASARLSPVEPAQELLREAAGQITALIDHVLGNEPSIIRDAWKDFEHVPPYDKVFHQDRQPQTEEPDHEYHGDRPGQHIAD